MRHIGFWKRCCVLRLELRNRLRARESREILEPVRCTIQQLHVHVIERTEPGSFGELANFCCIRIDENAHGASSCRERVHNSRTILGSM